MSVQILTRAALMLAVTLLFQSLRFIIPLPAAFSTFLIGSLVNACLIVAFLTTGFWPAVFIAAVTPIVAYMQSLLPLPVFIIPVAVGNLLYIILFKLLSVHRQWLAVLAASLGKMTWLYFTFLFLLSLLYLPGKMAAVLLMAMSWPQFVTGCLGGVIAILVKRRIKVLGK